MATAQTTIHAALRALRMLNMASNPSSALFAEGLDLLNAFLRELIAGEGAGEWRDLRATAGITLPSDYPALRVICLNTAAMTLVLPTGQNQPLREGFRLNVVDGTGAAASHAVTLDRGPWRINGAAANATLNTNDFDKLYMFRADRGDFTLPTDLVSGSALPFASEFDRAVALNLAERWGPSFNRQLTPENARLARRGLVAFKARYRKPAIFRFEAAAQLNSVYGAGVINEDGSLT